MSELHFPWMEMAIVIPLFGAVWIHFLGDTERAVRAAIVICAAHVVLTFGELIDFLSLGSFEAHDHWPLLSGCSTTRCLWLTN